MNRLCLLLGIALLVFVCVPALAVTTADLLVPLGTAPFDYEFGQVYSFSVGWQEGYADSPSSLILLTLGNDTGASDYVNRLRLQSGPVSLLVGDVIDTMTMASASGGHYTYQGLVGKFSTGGTLIQPGRILLETDPRFQAAATPPDYFTTGYNPEAWDSWLNSQDPTTGGYPITNRLMILPVIEPPGITGARQVTVVGFATFFIDRVWDGVTVDPSTGLIPNMGDMQVRFVPEGMLEPIPEPSGLLVLGGGMLALAGCIRRRRRSAIREDASSQQ